MTVSEFTGAPFAAATARNTIVSVWLTGMVTVPVNVVPPLRWQM
jgi:hypothetical protein